jgi:hypothetical protein
MIEGEKGSLLANAREAEQNAITAKEKAAQVLQAARSDLAKLEAQVQDRDTRRDPSRLAVIQAGIMAIRSTVKELERDYNEAVTQWRIAIEIIGIYQNQANTLVYERDHLQSIRNPESRPDLLQIAWSKNEQLDRLIKAQGV